MIHVNLIGGLGNQLFQYSVARRIQEETGMKIVLSLREQKKYYSSHPPSLNQYLLNNNVEFGDEKLPWQVNNRNVFSKGLRIIGAHGFYEQQAKKGRFIWYEDGYIDLPHINPNFEEVYLGGYWQSEKYFKSVLSSLQRELKPKNISDDQKSLAKFIDKSNGICLHIRRGDYVGSFHQVCSLDYYKMAVTKILEITSGTLFVFSDDIAWVKNNLSLPKNTEFMDKKYPDYIDLFLMSCCKHFVMSNSTFSWWGQELSVSQEKKVVAPSPWSKRKTNIDIYAPSWILLDGFSGKML